MRRLPLMLVPLALTLTIGSAKAVVVPQEWDGIWTTLDTVYTCAGAFQSTGTSSDTLCGGQEFSRNAPQSGFALQCTGTADATTIDATCTGSGEVAPDCNADFTTVTHYTRTALTFFSVTTFNATYSGTACSGAPPLCFQINRHGVYTGPSTAEACSATPVRPSTWGELKTRYR